MSNLRLIEPGTPPLLGVAEFFWVSENRLKSVTRSIHNHQAEVGEVRVPVLPRKWLYNDDLLIPAYYVLDPLRTTPQTPCWAVLCDVMPSTRQNLLNLRQQKGTTHFARIHSRLRLEFPWQEDLSKRERFLGCCLDAGICIYSMTSEHKEPHLVEIGYRGLEETDQNETNALCATDQAHIAWWFWQRINGTVKYQSLNWQCALVEPFSTQEEDILTPAWVKVEESPYETFADLLCNVSRKP